MGVEYERINMTIERVLWFIQRPSESRCVRYVVEGVVHSSHVRDDSVERHFLLSVGPSLYPGVNVIVTVESRCVEVCQPVRKVYLTRDRPWKRIRKVKWIRTLASHRTGARILCKEDPGPPLQGPSSSGSDGGPRPERRRHGGHCRCRGH